MSACEQTLLLQAAFSPAMFDAALVEIYLDLVWQSLLDGLQYHDVTK
jgi:hypothetical protein